MNLDDSYETRVSHAVPEAYAFSLVESQSESSPMADSQMPDCTIETRLFNSVDVMPDRFTEETEPKGSGLMDVDCVPVPPAPRNLTTSYSEKLLFEDELISPSGGGKIRKGLSKRKTENLKPSASDKYVSRKKAQTAHGIPTLRQPEAGKLPEPILEPEVISRKQCVYPEYAEGHKHIGSVRVEIEILSTGKIGEVKLKTTSTYVDLDDAALSAAKEYFFRPALQDGKPVSVQRTLEFKFPPQQ